MNTCQVCSQDLIGYGYCAHNAGRYRVLFFWDGEIFITTEINMIVFTTKKPIKCFTEDYIDKMLLLL